MTQQLRIPDLPEDDKASTVELSETCPCNLCQEIRNQSVAEIEETMTQLTRVTPAPLARIPDDYQDESIRGQVPTTLWTWVCHRIQIARLRSITRGEFR